MVKFGKLYREKQLVEFKDNYIDYKKLKRKIKELKEYFSSLPTGSLSSNTLKNILQINLQLSLDEDEYNENLSKLTIDNDELGKKLLEFKNLLDEEFQKCFDCFNKIKKKLHNKLNEHLYKQTNYSSYQIDEIIKEINNLKGTIYLAYILNVFINDNMMAVKKIIKKFDKKFNIYFDNFGPRYILDNLCKEKSNFEYLLESQIIDETNCIIESNVKLLKEYYLEINSKIKIKKVNDIFFQTFDEILNYIINIDELIYFKIQYKEWFYFINKKSSMKKDSHLYKNLMFNPILFSPFEKDNIVKKFLSRKEQIKEIEKIQTSLSCSNKMNIILIFIQAFFYNALLSGIYPLQFIYIRHIEDNLGKSNLTEYSFIIIASTYICSLFSIIIYHFFGIKRIKLSYFIAYIFFFIGSLFYVISYNLDHNVNFVFLFLIFSRIFIGFGANPLMGKKYILLYETKYFLPKTSKRYVITSIIGHSMGPFFVFIFFYLSKKERYEIFANFYFSKYNCIGWFGIVLSLLFIIINSIFFTSPSSQRFKKLKTKKEINEREIYESKNSQLIIGDDDPNEDKEFYQQQIEMSYQTRLSSENNWNINNSFNDNLTKKSTLPDNWFENKEKMETINTEMKIDDNNNPFKKNLSTVYQGQFNIKSLQKLNYKQNHYSIRNRGKEDDEFSEQSEVSNQSTFENIDMIPRTIIDLMKMEEKKFSYLNRNLLMIFIILFFCNLLKENFIGYSCYYIYNQNLDVDKLNTFSETYLSLFISISYFLELFSMMFILPLYKINNKLNHFLAILMSLSIILMAPICFKINLYVYLIIVSFIILISSFIEVLSSVYLAYLTPPNWEISHINAFALPLYIMNFGKLFGCLICFTTLAERKFVHHLNNLVVLFFTLIGYGISGIYIYRSKNFRIKAICRIIRRTELDSFDCN